MFKHYRALLLATMVAVGMGTLPSDALAGDAKVILDSPDLPSWAQGQEIELPPDYKEEITSDVFFFQRAGYKLPNYGMYYKLENDIVRDVAAPDYKKRTGMIAPDNALVQAAAIWVTGGDFNDLLVMTHFPGDCDWRGCAMQVYRTEDALTWKKVLDLHSYTAAYKEPTDVRRGELVGVGGEGVPNRYFRWDGKQFLETH